MASLTGALTGAPSMQVLDAWNVNRSLSASSAVTVWGCYSLYSMLSAVMVE